jgi:hypothetical protein
MWNAAQSSRDKLDFLGFSFSTMSVVRWEKRIKKKEALLLSTPL